MQQLWIRTNGTEGKQKVEKPSWPNELLLGARVFEGRESLEG